MNKRTLYFALSFFIKVDMAFTDPGLEPYPVNHPMPWLYPPRLANGSYISCKLRQTLLAERHLTPLWRALRGWSWYPDRGPQPMDKLDILRLWARHYYHPTANLAENRSHQLVLGIPWDELGTAALERRSAQLSDQPPLNPLLRPDELILSECVRRKITPGDHLVDMALWGFVDPQGRNTPFLTEEELLNLRLMPSRLRLTRMQEIEDAGKGADDAQPVTPMTAEMFPTESQM